MKYPETQLFMVSTRYATYPMLWIRFKGDHGVERTHMLPQPWVASPPAVRVPL